jgi:hypothetical protein
MTSKIPAQLPVMSCQKPFLFQIPYCASNYPGFSSSSLPRKIRRWQRVDELVSFSMLTSSHYFVSTRINMPVCDKPLALGQDLEGWGNLSKMGLLSILITLEGSLSLSHSYQKNSGGSLCFEVIFSPVRHWFLFFFLFTISSFFCTSHIWSKERPRRLLQFYEKVLHSYQNKICFIRKKF